MRTITITDEVWQALQAMAEPFVDEPEDVLRRLFGINETAGREENISMKSRSEPARNPKLGAKAQGKHNRQRYAESLRSKGIVLEESRGILYKSANGTAVAIPSATECKPGRWWLGMPLSFLDDGNELFVILLCEKDGDFLDFVLPPETVSEIAPNLSRDKDDKHVKFNIREITQEHYDLLLSGGGRRDITPFLHTVGALSSAQAEKRRHIVSFRFTVNKSFLETGKYPITIPREVHMPLQDSGIISESDADGDKKEIKVVGINGRSVRGNIYHGTAGFGPYYQIQLPTADVPSDFCCSLEIEDRIIVSIEKGADSVVARLHTDTAASSGVPGSGSRDNRLNY